jgi:hypothetical protein
VKRERVWFWLIAVSLIIFALCILMLQIVKLHEEGLLKSTTKQTQISIPPEEPNEEKPVEEIKEKSVLVDAVHRVILSQEMPTPRFVRVYNRILYSVPDGNESGFWALIRGLKPKTELIGFGEIAKLKHQLAKMIKTKSDLSIREIRHILDGGEPLNKRALFYISHALSRDIIVSNSDERLGCDLFTKTGEIFHYDSIDKINIEAENKQTLWLYDYGKQRWAVAIFSGKNSDEHNSMRPDVYFELGERHLMKSNLSEDN